MKSDTRTLVVGVGEVGGALAEVLSAHGPVLTHDLERREFAEPIDVMHLCIPFQSPEQFHAAAADYIARFRPQLVIINSTVMPGTTRTIAKATGACVVYSPVRGKHVKMSRDLLHYAKFVAAPEPSWAEAAENHFRGHGMKTRRLSTPETLEIAKLSETTYFGVIIAFAQEMNRYVEGAGGNYDEAASFFDEIDFLPRQRYFPGFIGGHCVIPNIKLLLKAANAPLLQAVLDSNRRRAEELEQSADRIDGSKRKDNGRAPKVLANR